MFLVVAVRRSEIDGRPDYVYIGVDGKLYAQADGKYDHNSAREKCKERLYGDAIPIKLESMKEAELIGSHFKVILPFGPQSIALY